MLRSQIHHFILATLLIVTCLRELVSAIDDDYSGRGGCIRSTNPRRKTSRDDEDFEYFEPEDPMRPPNHSKKKYTKKPMKHPDSIATSHEITVEDYMDDISTMEGIYTRETTYNPRGHRGMRPSKADQRIRKKDRRYKLEDEICKGRGDFEGLTGACHHPTDCHRKEGLDIGWCNLGYWTCCLLPEMPSTPMPGPVVGPGPATTSGPSLAPAPGPGPGPGPTQPSSSAPSVRPATTPAPSALPSSSSIRPSTTPMPANPSLAPSGTPPQTRPTDSSNPNVPTYTKRPNPYSLLPHKRAKKKKTPKKGSESPDEDEDDGYKRSRARLDKHPKRRITSKRPSRRRSRKKRRTTTTEAPVGTSESI